MSYQHQDVKSPRLTGWALRSLVAVAENPLSAALVRKQMLGQLGFDDWRQQPIEGRPMPWPLHAPGKEEPAVSPDDLAELVDKSEPVEHFERVADFRRAYLDDRSTPMRVVEKLLSAIDASEHMDRPLRAFIHIDRQALLDQAKASGDRYARGESLGPLDGVPVAVKDELDVAGLPTTVGTSYFGKNPAQQDATAVARLRAAGALIIGKTNMHEIGIGVTGINPNHGSPRNPYHLDHVTGGSSSGSAAAVAAGFCPIALGADGGGSIRIPAAFCGQFGIKASFGRVSGFGAAPLDWSVGHVGPIANNPEDLALAYALIAGADDKDPLSQGHGLPSLDALKKQDLQGLKIGVYDAWFDDAAPDIVASCRQALSRAQDFGAELRSIEIADLQNYHLAHLVTIVSEMAASQQPVLRAGHQHGTDVRLNMALARGLSSVDYVQAQRWRRQAVESMQKIFTQVDMIATPMTGVAAPVLQDDALAEGESDLELLTQIMRFATLGNLTGLPAISLPVAYDKAGLPLALQLLAAPWQEGVLLNTARLLSHEQPRPKPAWHVNFLG